MADLSSLFGAAQPARGRRDYFGLAAPHAARFKRQIVMREAMSQDLAPEDGEQFFKFVGRRLFELGDMQGAMAVNAQAEQYGAAQAAAQQQAFENQQALARGDREQQRIDLSADAGRRAEAQLDINALNQQVNRDRVTLEALRFEAGADTRALDEILKRQEVADGLVNHELKQVELQQ